MWQAQSFGQVDLFWDTFRSHSCGALLEDTLLRKPSKTLLWDTLWTQTSERHLWRTLVGHSCRALLWNLLFGHSCHGGLWDNLVRHYSIVRDFGKALVRDSCRASLEDRSWHHPCDLTKHHVCHPFGKVTKHCAGQVMTCSRCNAWPPRHGIARCHWLCLTRASRKSVSKEGRAPHKSALEKCQKSVLPLDFHKLGLYYQVPRLRIIHIFQQLISLIVPVLSVQWLVESCWMAQKCGAKTHFWCWYNQFFLVVTYYNAYYQPRWTNIYIYLYKPKKVCLPKTVMQYHDINKIETQYHGQFVLGCLNPAVFFWCCTRRFSPRRLEQAAKANARRPLIFGVER